MPLPFMMPSLIIANPVTACTISGSLSASGAGTTVTSTTRTITVPAGNSGELQFASQLETGAVAFEYQKNGGAWTTAEPDGTSVTFADADTLAVRITGAGSGESIQFDLVDVFTGTTIGSYTLEVP